MNLKYQLLVAAAALSLGACSTDDTTNDPVPEKGGYKISFAVAEDSETRTTLETLGETSVMRWVPTDKVGIYTSGNNGNNVNSNILTVADVNKSPVEFIGVLDKLVSKGDNFYAYYPYDAEQSANPTAVKLTIPAEQTQTKAGVYNGQSQPLVALPERFGWENDSYAGRISSVQFRLLGAMVELQIYSSDAAFRGEKIRSVKFVSDAPLAGDFTFDLTGVKDTEAPVISGYGLKEVTTTLEEPAAIPEIPETAETAETPKPALVYLTIAPGEYTGKIVVKTDAAQYTFNITTALKFDRAVITGLPTDLAKATRELPTDPIDIKDPEVKSICLTNWDKDKDSKLSYKEAAAVTSIGTIFQNNSSIGSFDELQYFTGLTSIKNSAFQNCSNLTSIKLPNKVTSIEGYAFQGCSNLTSINLPNEVISIGTYAFDNCSGLTSINLPEKLTSIGTYAFYKCSGLTSINLSEKLTSIGDDAFNGCSELESITIPAGVTEIKPSTFKDCSGLKSITISKGVKKIGIYAFRDCSNLTSIHIPDGVTEIGNYAFRGCSNLTSITIPEGVTEIKPSTFYGCGLKSITIPNGVKTIGDSAFYGCRDLTSITILGIVTSIGDSAFYGCSGLTSITIPKGLDAIGNNAFRDCSGLTNITIPEGVNAIGNYAFYNCIGLTSINIPAGVTTIGDHAFNYCSKLESVYCKPPTPPTLGINVFNNTQSEMKIYVPAGSGNAYKAATDKGWSDYASKIVEENN